MGSSNHLKLLHNLWRTSSIQLLRQDNRTAQLHLDGNLQLIRTLLRKCVPKNRDGRREEIFSALGHNPNLETQVEGSRDILRVPTSHGPLTLVVDRVINLADQRVEARQLVRGRPRREVDSVGPFCSLTRSQQTYTEWKTTRGEFHLRFCRN